MFSSLILPPETSSTSLGGTTTDRVAVGARRYQFLAIRFLPVQAQTDLLLPVQGSRVGVGAAPWINMPAARQGESVASRRPRGTLTPAQSVLAVLGKTGSTANVDRLDLKIVDPDASLTGRRKRKTSSTSQLANGSQSEDDAAYEDDPEASGIEAKLIIKLVCKHGMFISCRCPRPGLDADGYVGVTKKHSLHLASSDFLRAEVNSDTTPSSLTISAKSLRDILDHFALVAPTGRHNDGGMGVRGENQLGWMFTRTQVRIKSWEGVQQALMTEIKIDAGEFGQENYWVHEPRVDLTIPMKEFRVSDRAGRTTQWLTQAGSPYPRRATQRQPPYCLLGSLPACHSHLTLERSRR